ncbi:M15 family metallopeptidase [Segnochrobactraceae bacterium EtOH-i3]
MVDYLEKIPNPSKTGINQGLTSPSAAYMESILGEPRESYTGECQEPDNPSFKALITTRKVGPIKATGLSAALSSLDSIFSDVKNELPDLYALIGNAGMLCCRYKRIKGKVVKQPSNHSWGTAIDIKLGGVLDTQGDGKTLRGLMILAHYFNAHGWYWGASFPTEDAMHFEVARETLAKWSQAGLFSS